MGIFLGGLQPSIRDQLLYLELQDVFTAILAARRVAHSSKPPAVVSRPTFASNSFSRSTTTFQRPLSNVGPSPEASSNRPPQSAATHNSRRLIVAQQDEYRAKGKCFCCGGQYGPLHRCPPKTLAILLDTDDEEELQGVETDEKEP